MKILFIHGANSTRRSFNFLKQCLSEHDAVFFEYDTNVPCGLNITEAQRAVDAHHFDAIIGHSLGGVITTHLRTDAKKVAISTPFGGSALANWFPMFSQLMRDVATTSNIVRMMRGITADPKRFLAIVANGLDGRGFDGVLSARSQMALRGPTYATFNLNHFEVMVDENVGRLIDDFINEAE